MRIVLIGQAAFGAKALETLLEKDETMMAVYTPPDAPGGPTDPLKEVARAKEIPVYQPQGYKGEKVFEEYKELQPDLTILAFVTDIIEHLGLWVQRPSRDPPRQETFDQNGQIVYEPFKPALNLIQ